MLFSHICLKKSVCFASCEVFQANTGDSFCVDGGPLTLPNNYISRHKRCLVYNSILFIGNVDRILSEEYYMDTEG